MGFQVVLFPDWIPGCIAVGPRPVSLKLPKGRQKSSKPGTADGRNKQQGKAEVVTFFRSSHPSPD